MHHKRRRPKNSRAGCLLCKPHKAPDRARACAAVPGARLAVAAAQLTQTTAVMIVFRSELTRPAQLIGDG
jgi:hypothetical protein